MLCYLKFYFKQYLCGEERQYTTSPFLFFVQKFRPKNQKNSLALCNLIIVLIKMRLLIFLVLSRCGLAYKYGIIFQRSVYNWMLNCIL